MRVANGNGVLCAHFFDKGLNDVIEKRRVRVRRAVQVKNSAGSLLVVSDHVDVDHGQDVLQIVRMFVEVIGDPVVLGTPHEGNGATRLGKLVGCDQMVQQTSNFEGAPDAGQIVPAIRIAAVIGSVHQN